MQVASRWLEAHAEMNDSRRLGVRRLAAATP